MVYLAYQCTAIFSLGGYRSVNLGDGRTGLDPNRTILEVTLGAFDDRDLIEREQEQSLVQTPLIGTSSKRKVLNRLKDTARKLRNQANKIKSAAKRIHPSGAASKQPQQAALLSHYSDLGANLDAQIVTLMTAYRRTAAAIGTALQPEQITKSISDPSCSSVTVGLDDCMRLENLFQAGGDGTLKVHASQPLLQTSSSDAACGVLLAAKEDTNVTWAATWDGLHTTLTGCRHADGAHAERTKLRVFRDNGTLVPDGVSVDGGSGQKGYSVQVAFITLSLTRSASPE
ncbi:MAG: hypothetical protein M1838_002962 [Thelocarpon superellum]|nr:MAG: hypothetical protein M1838_002962 [Thelocarpon superellum]